MNNKKILNIVGVVLIGIFCLSIGYALGNSFQEKTSDSLKENTYISKLLKESPEGTIIEIQFEEGTNPASESFEGEKISIQSGKLYGRWLSFFGLGATEAAVKDQGFEVEAGGSSVVFGQNKGYGILESLWSKIKSLFWFGSFLGLALVACLFIPATAPIAGSILRGIASIFPFLGSIVERTVGGIKWKKPLNQTVSGGEEFKKAIVASVLFDDREKKSIIQIFKDSMMKKQDIDSQSRINYIKANDV